MVGLKIMVLTMPPPFPRLEFCTFSIGGKYYEGFVDWVNPIPPIGETQGVHPVPQIASASVEESEDDMFSLAVGFVTRMRK